MTKAIVSSSKDNNELTVIIEVRKLLLKKKAGDLTSNDIAHHAPGIGKNNGDKK